MACSNVILHQHVQNYPRTFFNFFILFFVDLILKNRPRRFQNSCTFKTGFSNFSKMTLTVLKSSFAEQKPRILNYLNYKLFSNTLFRDQLLNKLINSNFQISDKDLKHFKETCL